jgi:hypothetical protein
LPGRYTTTLQCTGQQASKPQRHHHQLHTVPLFEMSDISIDGVRLPLLSSQYASVNVCKEEGGLLWCMAMAKHLLNDGWQRPLL